MIKFNEGEKILDLSERASDVKRHLRLTQNGGTTLAVTYVGRSLGSLSLELIRLLSFDWFYY